MSERKWHKGHPPHIGWWNASNSRVHYFWRWWDGVQWSRGVNKWSNSENASIRASTTEVCQFLIEWTNYWPKNARVPRIDPRKKS